MPVASVGAGSCSLQQQNVWTVAGHTPSNAGLDVATLRQQQPADHPQINLQTLLSLLRDFAPN
ncbi:hypothetical protein HUJ05_011224 [Dendroctonus ponderosae]|nr:hypothetical protein HUJ05_011224 [Dendroctonus ponderosae]